MASAVYEFIFIIRQKRKYWYLLDKEYYNEGNVNADLDYVTRKFKYVHVTPVAKY